MYSYFCAYILEIYCACGVQEGTGSSYRRDALGGDLYATVLAALRFQVGMPQAAAWASPLPVTVAQTHCAPLLCPSVHFCAVSALPSSLSCWL